MSRDRGVFAKKRNQPQYTIASKRLKGSLDSHPRAIEFDTRHLIRISLWRGFYYDNVFSSSHALVFEGPAQLLHPLLRMGDDLRMKKWSLINVGSWSEGAKSLTPEKISTLHLTWGRLLPLLVFSASDIFFFLVTPLHKKMQFLFCKESNNLKFDQSYIKKDIITFMLQVKYH